MGVCRLNIVILQMHDRLARVTLASMHSCPHSITLAHDPQNHVLRPHMDLGVEPVYPGAQVRVRLLRRWRAQRLHLERTERRVRRVRLQLLLRRPQEETGSVSATMRP